MFNDYFKNILKIDTDKIKHLPQYAEDLFTKSEKDIAVEIEAASESKIYNFVFAGNIGDMQSVETIIKAANMVRERSDVYFHIVGDGSKLDENKQLANELELENVIFYGRRSLEEMPKFYGMADAMLITLKDNKTLSYTLPGKVQSYMAAGKPIIGAINGGTRRVIEEAECGFSCEAEDYSGLASLILNFCISDKKEQMAVNAQKFYFENYSKQRFMSILEEALFDLEGKNV
jgi:glycosyltransferase involved in cell wall biosynthesis